MKKLFLSIVLALAGFSAFAGGWKSVPFFTGNPLSVVVTNAIGITNLLTAGANSTNAPGTLFTNALGQRVVDTTGSTDNLLVDYIPIPRNVQGDRMYYWISNSNESIRSDFDVVVKLAGGSGADAAGGLALVFTPVYGKGADTEGVAGSGTEWWVGITPTTSTTLTVVTNVPLWKWPGAAGIRCRRVFNSDTDANGQVWITEFSLNGWFP